MKTCKKYEEWIWLSFYNELSPDKADELKEHLNTCADCTLDYQEAEKTVQLLNQKVKLQPSDLEMEANRSELHERLMLAKRARLRKDMLMKWWLRIQDLFSLNFAPRFRFAAALAILVIGIFMGKYILNTDIASNVDSDVLTNKNVTGVDYVKYNPKSGKVAVNVRVINDVLIKGNIDDPKMQSLLAQTLMTSEMPNVRLRSVDALSKADRLIQPTQTALISALELDDNPGIRLKAAKILNSLPVNEQVRDLLINTMIKVLQSEPNSAVRNAAVDGLSKLGEDGLRALLYEAAQLDSNEYLQYKTKNLRKTKLERPN